MSEVERLAYRPTEVAVALGCSRSRAYELIASGVIPSIDIGGTKRVPVSAIKALIEQKLEAQQLSVGA